MANSFTMTPASGTSGTIDLVAAALSPKRTRTEEGTVEERSINELIKAQDYIDRQNAPSAVPWGIRVARTKPGSTTPGA